MAISSSLRYSGVAKAATFDKNQIGVLPWPTWSGQKAGPMPVSGWWIAIWNKSQHIQEAAKFVDYMVGPEGVRLWATVGGQVPTRKSLLADPMFKQPDNVWVNTMVDAWSAWSWMEPTACNTRTLQTVLNEAVHRVVLQKTDATAALKEAEAKFGEAQK
jgi:multiple sugar transport system substrate-binding protein